MDKPLLILYPIWRNSLPSPVVRRNGKPPKFERVALGAAHDVLGAAILLPPKTADELLVQNYAVVRIENPDPLDEQEYQEVVAADDAQIQIEDQMADAQGN